MSSTPIDRKRLGQNALLEILRLIREEEPPRPSARLSTCETLASIAATRRTEPAKLARLLRGELDWIVMKCLEKERSRRYETANALARDLERYLHDEVVEARPPSASYRLRKLVRKHRTALAMAVTVALLLVAGVAVSTWQAVRATRAEGHARDEQQKTAEALTIAERNQQEAELQRKKAETQVASLAVDIDLKYCEDGDIPLGLLRLAETLKSIPEHARELRECAALNILAWGQKIRPAIGPLTHDGYAVTQAILSPDGRTVLSLGRDGTPRLWDSVSGKQPKILGQPLQGMDRWYGVVKFSHDGSTALTIDGRGQWFNRVAPDGDWIVRLWDVDTGQLRAATLEHPGSFGDAQLSQNGSLLVTCSPTQNTVFIWNARTGQLLRKVPWQGNNWSSIDVSPDGKWVLIAEHGQFAVWSPESDQPLKRLPGDEAVFSPSGQSAVSISRDTLYWWDTKGWRLHRTIIRSNPSDYFSATPGFISDEVLGVREQPGMGPEIFQLVILRNMPEIISEFGQAYEFGMNPIKVSQNGRVVVVGSHVYDGLSGQRMPLPWERNFSPELRQLSEDGRFTPFHISYIIDLVADKKIDFMDSKPSEWTGDGRFLKDLETWVVLSSDRIVLRTGNRTETTTSPDRIYVLRKADASLEPELLQKWCQVITRGKLDEGGHLSKLDGAAWEKARLELAHLLDTNPNAQSLRAAVSDPLYWLRQEIKDLESRNPPVSSLSLLDRLVAGEPTWPNYSQPAAAHANLEHWDLAIQDELEAARLAGERYWLGGTPFSNLQVGLRSVQSPGRPQEQYERALRWVEARTRAGVGRGGTWEGLIPPGLTAGLALFRLGRYAEALAMLRKFDVPMLSQATGMLMSPWNLLTIMDYSRDAKIRVLEYVFDPVDLLVRAMCHHHLGHPKEAKACLNQARGILPKDEKTIHADHRAFLRDAESLIEGKPSP